MRKSHSPTIKHIIIRPGQRLKTVLVAIGLGFCLASRAECPCETQDQASLQLAYENSVAEQNRLWADATTRSSSPSGGAPASTGRPKYLDPRVPIEERIDDLLPRMTLEEKVIELSDDWGSKGIPRLNIPAMLKTEGLHGQSYSAGATIFPMPIEMASTFDTNLIYRVGKATAIEAKAANLRVGWSPVLDVARDARWGRVEEAYGEDSYSNLATKVNDDGSATVFAEVENTGSRAGDDVVQLYVTDVHTSVITPVIEQQGFRRVSLEKGEKQTVTFELTPYQLSLLNADMERVVEPGTFRVHVGGASPEPPSGSDQHKQRIGFKDSAQGVSGEFQIAQKYAADFVCDMKTPGKVRPNETFPVMVSIKNLGNLLDVAEVKLYGDTLLGTHRFEIAPGQTRAYTFEIALSKKGTQNLEIVVGEKATSRTIKVSR